MSYNTFDKWYIILSRSQNDFEGANATQIQIIFIILLLYIPKRSIKEFTTLLHGTDPLTTCTQFDFLNWFFELSAFRNNTIILLFM